MSRIYVQGAPDRVARVSPKGRYVPHDKPIAAQLTPYLQRRIDQGDVYLITVLQQGMTSDSVTSEGNDQPKAEKAVSEKKSR